MKFPQVTVADWRAQVDKELAGASFEKTLVNRTPEGLSIQPLYTEAPANDPLTAEVTGGGFRICMRHDAAAPAGDLRDDVEGGADALWVCLGAKGGAHDPLAALDPARTFVVVDVEEAPRAALARLAHRRFALTVDPIGALARGRLDAAAVPGAIASMVDAARAVAEGDVPGTVAMASSLPYHDAGADDADEIALVLATGATYLEALVASGLSRTAAAQQIALQIAVGRDTFAELCKVRALRIGWQKILAAAGASGASRTLVHAVCSSRTLTQRDPWVNMLRVTTQVFAAVLGGADLVTPAAFDEALGPPSALGRRVARNTGLVLREESYLGKVIDPAGGSYYLETLTDALAREAWRRFQTIEREGGIQEAIASGRLRAQLETKWRERLDLVAKRKVPIVGVSEFANLGEKLPRAPKEPPPAPGGTALPVHRDAERFESLRVAADALGRPEAVLVTLGTLAESRPRVGFASNFFGAGGLRVRETTSDEAAPIACLCGTDERYAAEAVARVRALKAAGCKRVLVAGRPGALEAPLREAGVDGFVFVGSDAVAILSELQDVLR